MICSAKKHSQICPAKVFVKSGTHFQHFVCTMEHHWTSPTMLAAFQAIINTPQSDRLKKHLKFPHGFWILIFLQLFMILMIKPIVNRLGEAYDNLVKVSLEEGSINQYYK